MFEAGEGRTRIDIRSVWFLLLYSSKYLEKLADTEKELLLRGEHDNDLFDLLAQMLAKQTDSRLRSMLFPGYRSRTENLTRVRGRIDHLGTARSRLMESGRIRCHYSEQTVNIPRYRYMLVTLRRAAHQALSADTRLACITTARMLERAGVTPIDPTIAAMSQEQYGYFDAVDQKLVRLSGLVRDMCAPEHSKGSIAMPSIVRDERTLRQLFESAVREYYKLHLKRAGYFVGAERRRWPATGDADAVSFLPALNADVVMRRGARQVVMECKFAPLFTTSHGKVILSPDYFRQLYSYVSVFSREFNGVTEGVLLGALVRETEGHNLDLELDGHPIKVRQIDLSQPPSEIRRQLFEAAGILPLETEDGSRSAETKATSTAPSPISSLR